MAAYSTSSTSVLLPLPLGPVMAVSVPSGIWTLMLRRLLWRAPRMVRQGGWGLGVGGWGGLESLPFLPVRFFPLLSSSAPVPSPQPPAPGLRFFGTGIDFLPVKY